MKPVKLPVRLLATTIMIVQIHPTLAAQGGWEQGTKDTYVARCNKSMLKQGLAADKATGYCRCAVDGLEVEFGKKDYDTMMRAQPNPQGSDADKRPYKVLNGCSQWLPQ
jgi:hypothetical protein